MNMLPDKNLNIYPKTVENVKHVVSFYCDEFDLDQKDAIEFIMERTSLKLNQVEFILKIIHNNINYFKRVLNGKLSLTNLMSITIDALTLSPESWQGSSNRVKIIADVKNLILLDNLNMNDEN